MKKRIVCFGAVCCVLFLLAACAASPHSSTRAMALGKLPTIYTPDQAKADGCVVYENSDITHGQAIWDTFVTACAAGSPAQVRLGFYYTLQNASAYDASYYASALYDFPLLVMQDLTFNGHQYTLRWFEDGREQTRTYAYLLRFETQATTPQATYDICERYILANTPSLTWEEIQQNMLSSQAVTIPEHEVVYINFQS